MKWKKRFTEFVLLILTVLLPITICSSNSNSSSKHRADGDQRLNTYTNTNFNNNNNNNDNNNDRRNSADDVNRRGISSLVPGYQTAILQNGHVIHLDHLRLLDPYNLFDASAKQDGSNPNHVLEELLPPQTFTEEEEEGEGEEKDKRTGNRNKNHSKSNKGKGSDKEVGQIDTSSSSLNHNTNTINDSSSDSDSHNANASSDNDNDGPDNTTTRNESNDIEDSYFDESDFDLYDDYDDLDDNDDDEEGGSTKGHFNNNDNYYNLGEDRQRRRKKGHNSRNPSHVQNALLHEAVRKLLGFSHSRSSWSQKKQKKNSQFLPDPFGQEKIPRYVKDLYERFQSGEMNAGLAQGNTIRSIHASVGDVEGESMFLFNLSSLRSSERLLNAEIHLYKRRSSSRSKGGMHKLDIDVKLFRVAPHYLSEVGRITLRDDVSHGWLWYDVTNAVQNCVIPLHRRSRRRHAAAAAAAADLFALSFRVKKPNGKVKSVSLRKFGRHHSMPFLVLYSNETEAVSFEHLDILTDRLWPKGKNNNNNSYNNNNNNNNNGRNSASSNSIDSKDGRNNSSIPPAKNDTTTSRRRGNRPDRERAQKLPLNNNDSAPTFQRGDFNDQLLMNKRRRRRSIYDNEIPENPVDTLHGYHDLINTVPQTLPGILKTRKEPAVRNNHKSYSSFLPLPHHYGNNHRHKQKNNHKNKNHNNKNNNNNNNNNVNIQRKRRKKTHHRHKKFHHRKNRLPPFPKSWDSFAAEKPHTNTYNNNNNYNRINNNNNANRDTININSNNNKNNINRQNSVILGGEHSSESVCGRSRLTVDFADIGWGDWIISPKSFEAHYCSGTCPFPLNKRLRPSNHATIQSIVHAIGIHGNVPAPCCVPDKMSSVTLLYFDEDRNVVLKNYPGMTVESCACR